MATAPLFSTLSKAAIAEIMPAIECVSLDMRLTNDGRPVVQLRPDSGPLRKREVKLSDFSAAVFCDF
jgi:hypothetical protein